MKKIHTVLSLLLVIGGLFAFHPQRASAINIEISNNGRGSKNCVIVKTVNGEITKLTTQCATASVPEFGMIPGIAAVVGSAGSLLVLRKRK
jgi:hypothetical protein